MEKIFIDAKGAVFGRLCSFAAKKALEGYEIIVVNSEQAIMSGNKTNIAQKYLALRAQGGHS
ncbi:MAG: uL13 family ribosomal protein, partial [archaeon]